MFKLRLTVEIASNTFLRVGSLCIGSLRVKLLAALVLSSLMAPLTNKPAVAEDLSLVGDLLGVKNDLELQDAINYDQCFDYSQSFSITFSPKCMISYLPPIPAPVFKYKAKYTEPTAIVELTMEPGGGAIKESFSGGTSVADAVDGQGLLRDIASGNLADAGSTALAGGGIMQGFGDSLGDSGGNTRAYVGNQNPNMPVSGKIPNVYFDGHVWGVGPAGLLEAAKGGELGQGGSKMRALKSMACWIAEAANHWAPVPGDASAHLKVIAPVAKPYVGYYLGDWGTRWYNKGGSSQVSATTVTSFKSGFSDNSALGLAALGAFAGQALASGDDKEVCQAKQFTEQKKQLAADTNQQAQANEENLNNIAPRATYLPAGYEQVDTGYDTCPLTGVGHFINEETGNIGFNNCDPQERLVAITCDQGRVQSASFVTADQLGRGFSGSAANAPRMDPYQSPCRGGPGLRVDSKSGGSPTILVRAPSCHNRLSGMQEQGKYLACNSDSTTFARCTKQLNGAARMVPGHGSGLSGDQAGSFSLCAGPEGSRVVNHLEEFNQNVGENIVQASEDFQKGVDIIDQELDERIQEREIECKTEEGSNGLAGAALGAGAGFAASQGVEAIQDGDFDLSFPNFGGDGEGDGEGGNVIDENLEQAGEFYQDITGQLSDAIEDSEMKETFLSASEDFNKTFEGVSEDIEGAVDDVSESLGGVREDAEGVFNDVNESLGGVREEFEGIADDVNESLGGVREEAEGIFDDVSGEFEGTVDVINENVDQVKGQLSDITQGAGLGSLSSATSKASALLTADGSIGSVTNIASAFGVMPDWMNSAVSMFNQETIMPLYLSEDSREDWRSEHPAKKMARMNVMQNIPLANDAMGFADNIANFNCGSVGVWGQLCPLRGFVETTGNNFPASGLAGWRAYHKALPKIPDRKRMATDKPTVFNLDYPHQSACHEIGARSDEWETRRDGGGGVLNQLFGGAAQGLSSIFSAGNPEAGLGDMFGEVNDKRAESGVFVYTYWKDTKCRWDVCTIDLGSLSGLGDIPGLEQVGQLGDQIKQAADQIKQAAPVIEQAGGIASDINDAVPDFVADFAKKQAKKNIPGSELLDGFESSEEGQEALEVAKEAKREELDAELDEEFGGEGLGDFVSEDAKQAARDAQEALGLENIADMGFDDIPELSAISDQAQDLVGSIPGIESLSGIPNIGKVGKIIKFKHKE